MEQHTGSKSGKEYVKPIHCHPAYLTCMQSTSCEMPDYMRYKLGSRLPQICRWLHPMSESEEELKSLLMKLKEESEKLSLKLNIQKSMASGFITSWQIDGEMMGSMRDFIFLGSKITEDSDCRHEIKSRLILRWKAMTNIDSILKKQRHYFANKVPSSQNYGFSNSHVWIWVWGHNSTHNRNISVWVARSYFLLWILCC